MRAAVDTGNGRTLGLIVGLLSQLSQQSDQQPQQPDNNMTTATYYDTNAIFPRTVARATRPPKTTETTEAAKAVLRELHVVLDTDLFGIAELTHVAEIAEAGRLLLQATEKQSLEGVMGNLGTVTPGGNVVTNPAETFGATAMREIQAVLPKLLCKSQSPEDLVRAIAAARAEKMDDIADDLRAQLRGMLAGSKEQDGPACGCVRHPITNALSPANGAKCATHPTAAPLPPAVGCVTPVASAGDTA